MHVGEYVIVYPCYPIMNFTLATEQGKCHNGVPINYKLANGKMQQGYLNPTYNNIIPKEREVDCHKKGNLYTFIDNELRGHSPHGRKVEQINVSAVLSLQHMPIAGIPLPENYLDTDWVYNVSELAHTDIGDKVLDVLEREIDQLNKHKKNIKGDATVKSTEKWWNILGMFETNVFSGINAIITWGERICVLYMLWIVVIKGKLVYCRARVRENAAADD